MKGQVTLPPSREADFFYKLRILLQAKKYGYFITLIHF